MYAIRRISPQERSSNYLYQRQVAEYQRAAGEVYGDVLEIGGGSNLGALWIAPKCTTYTNISRRYTRLPANLPPHVEFRTMKYPPFREMTTAGFDCIVCMHVIEHIADDFGLLREIHRMLRPGGKLIIATPNKKKSLSTNPFHVREYTADEFKNLMGYCFRPEQALGIYGNDKVMAYYEKNRKSTRFLLHFDPFGLIGMLPRFLLKLPYLFADRFNRRRLLIANRTLTTSITVDDYQFAPADDDCFDLFFIVKR